jgi:V-type H+-transporting ATPase subunit E
VLRCREADRSLVEAVLEVAKKEYAEKAKVNLPKVIIDGKVYLPPQRTSGDVHAPSWYVTYILPPLLKLPLRKEKKRKKRCDDDEYCFCFSGAQRTNSSGGVVLASQDGKIVCQNTLDARLNVSFRQKLPEVRRLQRLIASLYLRFLLHCKQPAVRIRHDIVRAFLLQIRKKLFSKQAS